MLKPLTIAVLVMIAAPVPAAEPMTPPTIETPYSDAFMADWRDVIEALGQVGGQSEYTTALERATAIAKAPAERLKVLEGAVKVCELMQKGRISSGEMSRAITKDLGGRPALSRDRDLRVRWIMAQAALKSAVHVVCPGVR